MYELIAFDLDGTLTEHRTQISEINYELLERIKERYKIVIVGAGTCDRIIKQLREFPIDVIGNYGMQTSIIVNKERINKKACIEIDKADIKERIKIIRSSTGYVDIVGESIEFHESGVITFPLLGTKANIKDKVAFDPQRKKRKKIYAFVKDYFPEYTVVIGGSSSFDIMPKEYDKYKALVKYASDLNISTDKILYVGDDFSEGGNDEPIYKSEIECIEIESYQILKEKLHFLL